MTRDPFLLAQKQVSPQTPLNSGVMPHEASTVLKFDFKSQRFECNDDEMQEFLSDVYHQQRYLAQVQLDDLVKRLDGLLNNLIDLSFDGERKLEISSGKISLSFIDLIEEFKLRHEEVLPHIVQSMSKFDRFSGHRAPCEISKKLEHFQGKRCLFKFTERKYVDSLVSGCVRFKLASAYANDGYNIAIRDDELNLDYQLSGATITAHDGTRVPIRDGRIKRSAGGDYYVSCYSYQANAKLFRLFNRDACVAILDGPSFCEAARLAYLQRYPDAKVLSNKIGYLDPLREMKYKQPIEFLKTFDFEYEAEYRLVAIERNSASQQETREVQIDMSQIEHQVLLWQ